MKQFVKGASIQLIINILMHIVRMIVAFLIIKYAPAPSQYTSFGKDSGWQILSLFLILSYNNISLIVSFIEYEEKKTKFFIGIGTISILATIYALKVLGI